jgi:carboxyl-terminal processing protease
VVRPWLPFMGLAVVLSLALGFGGGVAYQRWYVQQGTSPSEPADAQATFGVFWQAWRLVKEYYVDQSVATPQRLTYGAISGMLDSLGDTGHTRFLSPSDRTAENNSLAGKLDGIGVEVELRNDQITIVAPLDNSPAERAGLKAGDVIVKVNGQDVTHLGLDAVSNLIRGPEGTQVQLTILRPGASEFLQFTLTREVVHVPDVTWTTVPGQHIAQVRISSFGTGTDDELRTALKQARAAGDTALILDLRNDPGGLLDEAVKVASEFISSGNVLLEQDRSGKQTPVPVDAGGVDPKEPMVVLVDHGTASAAEIVAGALQDHNRATVVGEQTFGTGTVLHEYPLSDGSAILLGVSEWLTPNGHFIRNNGITPDQVVAEASSTEPLTPLEERSMSATAVQQSGDQQLLRAIQDLK